MPVQVGMQLGAATRPVDVGTVAAEAERLGYGELWLAEDYFHLGGIASVASALASTQTIPVGLGVVAAAARHPAVTAMEFATLAEAHPGRFRAGLGHGAPGWVGQMGLTPASPVGLLSEATTAIRALLDGEQVTIEGDYFRMDGISLGHLPTERVPLYLGVHGPASLRLSGELADGTLLGWFTSPGYADWARARIDEGRERRRLRRRHELVALCLLSVSDADPVRASRELAGWAEPIVTSMATSPVFDPSITGQDPPDELLTGYVASGSVASCIDTVSRLLESEADRVVLVPNPAGRISTSRMVAQMESAAAIVDAVAGP